MTRFALTAERVFDGNSFEPNLAVVIEGARIFDLVNPARLGAKIPLRQLGAGSLTAGFVDVQVNGGGGVLLNETPTVDGVRKIAGAHRKFGTTGLLPTVITDAPEVMRAAADAVSQAMKQDVPGVLGIHIEGPFIDVKRKGAHDARFIRRPTEEDIQWLCGLDCGRVLLTLAPNVVAPETIKRLVSAGIVVSLGHSDATAEEANAALAAGASGFTHLFNAMSQMTGRAPGTVGAALSSRQHAYCGLIADGHHVDPVSLKVAIAALGDHSAFFVSDAMPSAAGGPASFELQGRPVEVVNGRLQLADGTLAGANVTMLESMRYASEHLDLKPEAILRMASSTPASFLGLHAEIGHIAANCRANLVHLSDDLDVFETWIDGVSSK